MLQCKCNYMGDILTTKDNKHSGWHHGHAGIVMEDNNYTVEAFDTDGVQVRNNTWKRANERKGPYVRGAVRNNALHAQLYAYSKKGHNYSLTASKSSHDVFYCSSLVWKAWNEQGYDLDDNGGYWVLPMDLRNDYNTIEFNF